jgi:hypothetical protein
MTQQVLLVRTLLPYVDPSMGRASFAMTWEQVGSDLTVDQGLVATAIEYFLNTAGPGASEALAYYLSPGLNTATNACEIEFYDVTAHLDGSPAGAPIGVTSFTLADDMTSQIPLPEGVAALFRWRADYGTDVEYGTGARPRARDRNRFYLGPLNERAVDGSGAGGTSAFKSQFLTDANDALGIIVAGALSGSSENVPVVWSRKNASVKPTNVELYGVDPRPKYQRRRALA